MPRIRENFAIAKKWLGLRAVAENLPLRALAYALPLVSCDAVMTKRSCLDARIITE